MHSKSANLPALTARELTGRSNSHVRELAGLPGLLHPGAGSALLALRTAARAAGIDLLPLSSFRDFDRQLAIWNGKFRGERPLLDRDDRPLVAAQLSPPERISAILAWSALPGASRHHWGSDCDVIDQAALPAGESVQLLASDYAPGGRYAALSDWLANHAADYGFFRPYDRDRGGVLPEPWHLSFAPVAQPALAAMTPGLLAEALAGAGLAGEDVVLPRLEEIFGRFVAGVASPEPAALAAAQLSRASRPA
jgi:LAS superfamily LD-carboxypeptidase LdcB